MKKTFTCVSLSLSRFLSVARVHSYSDVNPRCIAIKRDHLFSDNNRDLALVAKTWPELLPGVRDLHAVMVTMVLVVKKGT